MVIVLAGPIVTQLPIALSTHLREKNAAKGYSGLCLIQAFTTRDRKPNTWVEGERKIWAGLSLFTFSHGREIGWALWCCRSKPRELFLIDCL